MSRSYLPATEMNFAGYRMPDGPWIGQSKHTKKLYELEQKRSDAVLLAARELGRVLAMPTDGNDFWRLTMPEALHSVLDSFDPNAAILAAVTLLRRRGVIVHTDDFPNLVEHELPDREPTRDQTDSAGSLLAECLTAFDNEEDSVKTEHADLIARIRKAVEV